MNRDILEQAGVNYAEGVKRFAGKEVLYEKYIRKFPDDPSFLNLQTAMEENDVDTAFRASHTMKGIVGNLSFNRLMEKVVPVVEALRVQDLETAQKNYQPLVEEYQVILKAIEEA